MYLNASNSLNMGRSSAAVRISFGRRKKNNSYPLSLIDSLCGDDDGLALLQFWTETTSQCINAFFVDGEMCFLLLLIVVPNTFKISSFPAACASLQFKLTTTSYLPTPPLHCTAQENIYICILEHLHKIN